MTDLERQASAINYGKVVFDGARATLGAGLTLDPRTAFRATAPAALAGEYEYGTASFGQAITPANFSGTVVLGTDGVGAANDGWEQLQIGRAHVWTPVPNAHPVCRLLLRNRQKHIPTT